MGNGSKAKRNGTKHEQIVEDVCKEYGLISTEKKYIPIWPKKRKTTKDLHFDGKFFKDGKSLSVEVKYQSGGGGAEARCFGEIPNIFECVLKNKFNNEGISDKAILVMLGKHWETDNPQHAVNARKYISKTYSIFVDNEDDFQVILGLEELRDYLSQNCLQNV